MKIKAAKELARAQVAEAYEREIELAKAEAQATAEANAPKPFFNPAIWEAEDQEQEQAA